MLLCNPRRGQRIRGNTKPNPLGSLLVNRLLHRSGLHGLHAPNSNSPANSHNRLLLLRCLIPPGLVQTRKGVFLLCRHTHAHVLHPSGTRHRPNACLLHRCGTKHVACECCASRRDRGGCSCGGGSGSPRCSPEASTALGRLRTGRGGCSRGSKTPEHVLPRKGLCSGCRGLQCGKKVRGCCLRSGC